MSKPLVLRIAENLLKGFPGISVFEIGIRLAEENAEDGEERMRIQSVDRDTLLSIKYLKFLQAMNVQGRHIYIRPKSPHSFTLIDDVLPEKLGWAENEGLEPCLVIETSPDNFQLWLNHNQTLENDISTQAAKLLAEWFSGDPSSADFLHFGRFPGFTNPKPKYLKNGRYPFTKLHQYRAKVYSKSEFVCSLAKDRFEQMEAERKASQDQRTNLHRSSSGATKRWDDFYNDSRYGGDCNRVDMAYALYALSHDIPAIDVESVLFERDLSHKGSAKRQEGYVTRTINKAQSILSQ